MRVTMVPLADLAHDPANARMHDERNVQAIMDSLKQFGQDQALVVQREGMIVRKGNGRMVAMRRLGWTHAAAVVVDEDNVHATARAIADNRTSELAKWDEPVLHRLLTSLPPAMVPMVGFNDDDMKAMLDRVRSGPGGAGHGNKDAKGSDDEEKPDEKNVVSRLGDVWSLGEHRLMCGSSLDASNVATLMGGDKAALFATDPPYLVDYTGADRPNGSGKDWSDDFREFEIKDATGFFRGLYETALPHCVENVALYCWHADRRYPELVAAWKALDLLYHQQIIWVKPSILHGYSFWPYQHEPCLFGWRKGHKPPHDGDWTATSSTVWNVDWEGASRIVGNEHPTQKPIELFRRPMRKHTQPGAICYEPFSGSGSQIMAGEVEGRRVRAMELSPVFVDVAIRRFIKSTGKPVELVGAGGALKPYLEVAADRGVPVDATKIARA